MLRVLPGPYRLEQAAAPANPGSVSSPFKASPQLRAHTFAVDRLTQQLPSGP